MEIETKADHQTLSIDGRALSLGDIVDVARNHRKVTISKSQTFVSAMEKSMTALRNAVERGEAVYGVTTGFGSSCGNRIDPEASEALGINLIRYHGCGTGEFLDTASVRAAILCRIACFAKCRSGVSIGLLSALADLLNYGITPLVPSIGSVGASGDLTPMSYVAATLIGEREVLYKGQRHNSSEALKSAELKRYSFGLREALALMNGTAVMTGIAALVLVEARKLLDASLAGTALCLHALGGHPGHYHPEISVAKAHSGQVFAASSLNDWLSGKIDAFESTEKKDLQDPYSLRCAPQISGVLADTLAFADKWILQEIDSANDNPLVDPQTGEILRGGNFYGGHVAQAMDSLKTAMAVVADMLDRQLAMLVDPRFNRGLPENLVTSDSFSQHGFKAMQISASAIVGEMQKNTHPASVFSRSTEGHNQDIVSMGTIAARDALRQSKMFRNLIAIHLLASTQAAELRGGLEYRPALLGLVAKIRSKADRLETDRAMDHDIEALAELLSHTELRP